MSIALRIIKGIFATLFSLLVIFIIGFFIWRITSSDTPKSMGAITPTESVLAAYEEYGESMTVIKQEQATITRTEKNYGYFSITDNIIIPDANEVQLIFRYNNSTLRSTAEDFSLPSVPSRDDEVYDVTLSVAIDLTPENKDDNLGNNTESVKFVRCHGTLVASEQQNIYNFRKLVFNFDDCELDISELMQNELLLAIYADIYYAESIDAESIDYESEAYGTLCVYDYITQTTLVELDKKDIAALEN